MLPMILSLVLTFAPFDVQRPGGPEIEPPQIENTQTALVPACGRAWSFTTNVPATGEVWYSVDGSGEWHLAGTSSGTSHSASALYLVNGDYVWYAKAIRAGASSETAQMPFVHAGTGACEN